MKTKHAITKALMLFAAILIVSQGCAHRSESVSHVVQEGNTAVEYFSKGQGDVVVLTQTRMIVFPETSIHGGEI